MNKKIKNLISVLLIVSILFSLTGCNKNEKEIENLMNDFQIACNTLDFDGVLDCITPKISNKIRIATGAVGMFIETDTDEMFQSLSALLSKEKIGGAEFFSSIKIEVENIEVEDEKATVDAVLTYTIAGEEIKQNAVFKCEYYDDQWYISRLNWR